MNSQIKPTPYVNETERELIADHKCLCVNYRGRERHTHVLPFVAFAVWKGVFRQSECEICQMCRRLEKIILICGVPSLRCRFWHDVPCLWCRFSVVWRSEKMILILGVHCGAVLALFGDRRKSFWRLLVSFGNWRRPFWRHFGVNSIWPLGRERLCCKRDPFG